MYKRLGIYLILAAALAAVLVWQRARIGTHATAHTAPADLAADPARDEDPIHLAPDHRALLAVSEVHRLLTGQAGKPVDAHFDGGKWHVLQNAAEIGTLPEYPDFADFTALLVHEAGTLNKSTPIAAGAPHPDVEQALDRFDPLGALIAADREWKSGKRDATLQHDAARALIQLTTQTNDIVGAADQLSARALAELAICRSAGLPGLERDEALLADRMGYGARATAVAATLPANDPIGPFVRRDDSALARLANDKGASGEARFLELMRLAANHDDADYGAWVRRHYLADSTITMPVLATMLSLGTFDSQVTSAAVVLVAIDRDLRLYAAPDLDAAVTEPSEMALAVKRFEASMASMRPSADGQWLDRGLLRSYYRAAFYSAMWRLGEFTRQSLSTVEGTNDLAAAWSDLPAGPAEEFGRWYAHLAEMKSGHPAPIDLKSDLTSLPSFGSRLRFSTFEACARTPIGRLNGVRPQARILLGQLDTRPGDRLEAMMVIRNRLFNLVGAESLLASAARTVSPADVDVRALWAYMNGNRATLRQLLDAPGISALQATQALGYLELCEPQDVVEVCADYEKAVARFPRSADLVLAYTGYARDKDKPPAYRRRILQAWLARNPDDNGLDQVFVTTAIARTFQREKRFREALAVASGVASSQQYGAMATTADLMDLCGRGAEAETLAAFALHRYPDSHDALMGLVGMFWRHARYDEAAALLQEPTYRLDDGDWYSFVAPEFADRFADKPEAAIQAVQALEHAGFRSQGTLGVLATLLHRRSKTDLALKIEQHVQDTGQDGVTKIMACAIYLSELEGPDAARGYVLEHVAGTTDWVPAMLGNFAFGEERPDVLWECEPKESSANSCHWLLRAAAARYPGPESSQYADGLRAHYDAAGTEHYYVLGRYMIGLVPESAALALRVTPHAACEVDYYIGYRAQSEGRYADAALWYERCIATGQSRNFEYMWSYSQLAKWAISAQTLDRLAAADRASHARPFTSTLGLAENHAPTE